MLASRWVMGVARPVEARRLRARVCHFIVRDGCWMGLFAVRLVVVICIDILSYESGGDIYMLVVVTARETCLG